MYKLVVGNISAKRKKNWFMKEHNPYSVWDGSAVAVADCRISALSSADYCLHSRNEVDWGCIAWKGTAAAIRKLFRAEGLDEKALSGLRSGREYAVVFQEFSWGASCA